MAREHRERGRDREEREGELIDKLVHINRVAKVVKGGRRFGFAALVVVGDQRGRVGFGHGKAREVPEAIRKATDAAKRNMIRVPLKDGRTLHHETAGHHGAGKVIVRPAVQGTGIIAGGPMRAVFEALGVGDVVAKSRSAHRIPIIWCARHSMRSSRQQSPRMIAQRRGKTVSRNHPAPRRQGCQGRSRGGRRIMNTPKDTKETPAKKPAAKKTPPAAGHAKKEMPKTAAAPQAKPATKKPQAKPIAGNTVTVRQIRSVNRQPEILGGDLAGPWPWQDQARAHAGRHAGGARHDPQNARLY